MTRPFHGVRAVGLDDTTLDRCLAFAPSLLEGQFFSHTTALRLWGIPVPAPADARLHVSVRFPRTPPRGRGIAGHALRRAGWRLHLGLPAAGPASAWRQSAALLDLDALVAAADALLGGPRDRTGRRRAPLCTIDQLTAALAAAAGSPGQRTAAEALGLARVGVGSPAETRLRLLIVRAGMPEPVVDHPVTVGGGRVWHPDLAFPAARVAIEYEGDGHRERARWRRDIARREAFEDAGWRVVRVTAEDLDDPSRLIERLSRLLAERGPRPSAR